MSDIEGQPKLIDVDAAQIYQLGSPLSGIADRLSGLGRRLTAITADTGRADSDSAGTAALAAESGNLRAVADALLTDADEVRAAADGYDATDWELAMALSSIEAVL